MRTLATVAFLCLTLCAQTPDELIARAFEKNPSLKAIQQRLSAVDEDIRISTLLANPELSFSISDIQFDDVTDRSIEPMQYHSIGLKQKLPYFGEREALKEVALTQRQVLFHTLEEARVQLAAAIKKELYTIWELEALNAINDDFRELAQQNIELNQAYTVTSQDRHMGIMSAELMLSQLKIQKNEISRSIDQAYARLSYLVGENVQKIILSLDLADKEPLEMPRHDGLAQNHAVKAKESALLREKRREKVHELSGYPDTTVQAGYFQRNGFKDYMSVQVGFTLPIYGRESLQLQRSQKETLLRREELTDEKSMLHSRLLSLYAELEDAHASYEIIEKESLPQIEHMFELTNASVQSGGDLFKYIDLLKQKFSLDAQKIKAVARYHKARADIDALRGAL